MTINIMVPSGRSNGPGEKIKGNGNSTQVKLQKNDTFEIVWIPSPAAVLNKVLNIYKNKAWDTDWQVVEVYETRPSEEIEKNQNNHYLFKY